MPLIEQSVTVKVISDHVMIRYESEGESFAFVMSNQKAETIANALKKASKSKGSYEYTVHL
jgi:hypothetical protein